MLESLLGLKGLKVSLLVVSQDLSLIPHNL